MLEENIKHCHRCEVTNGCMGRCLCQGLDIITRCQTSNCPLGKFGALEITQNTTTDYLLENWDKINWMESEWAWYPQVQAAYRIKMQEAISSIPEPPGFDGEGIVTVIGKQYFAAGLISVRLWRHVGFKGTIEVFYDSLDDWQKSLLDREHVLFHAVNLTQQGSSRPHYELKTHAVLHSSLQKIIYIDADCYSTRDPSFLFDNRHFHERGAIFWADKDCFEIPERIFQALNIPRRGRPLETGQFALDKSKVYKELWLANWMDRHARYYYHLMNGDTGTLRFGFDYFDTPIAVPPQQYQVNQPAMLHFDFDDNLLWVHRSESKFCLTTGTAASYPGKWVYPPVRNDSLPLEKIAWDYFEQLRRAYKLQLTDRLTKKPKKDCGCGRGREVSSRG